MADTRRSPALIAGRSALEEAEANLRWRALGIILIAVVVVAAAPSMGQFDGSVRWLAILGLALPGLATSVLVTRSGRASRRAQERERGAGYATLFTEGEGTWQLEPRTGAVLRGPEDQPISGPEARRRARASSTASTDAAASPRSSAGNARIE